MPAIGMILAWAGYAAGLYGYSLIRGYCNTPAGLLNPVRPQPWSTTVYTGTGVIPSGCAGQAPRQAAAAGSAGGTPTTTDISKGQIAGANPVIVGVAGRGK